MHHATGPQRENAGHQKREDIEQHHPDLVLADIALTGVVNRHHQREQGPDAEQMNRAEEEPVTRWRDGAPQVQNLLLKKRPQAPSSLDF